MDYKKIVKVLEKEVGYEEGKNNDNKYGKDYGWNNVAYCVIFMWWAFKEAGASDYFCGGTKQASCTKVKEWAQAHNCWVTKDYKPGDLLLFNFNGKNTPKHIGFLVEVKNGLYNLEEARAHANDAIEHIDLLCDGFLKNEHTVDSKIDALLDDVQYEIMKIAIKKEIGD